MIKKTIMTAVVLGLVAIGTVGCKTDAEVASYNLSKSAEMFEINRRVVFFNGITDKYLMSIEGRCSIESRGSRLDVTCKVSDKQFKKHYLGLSDNVSYFVEQLESSDASTYRYKVIFKPSVIIPDIDVVL